MNNKLNAIVTFLRVAEAGSFSAAARQIGVKQSAVSQQIAALEAELGVVLLRRTTRAMALTEQGEKYRREMKPLLDAMREAEINLNPAGQHWQGRVHVQLPSGLGRLFLPHLLALQKAHPELHLELSFDDRIADLVSEGVDVALRLASEPPESHAVRVLGRIATALYAAPEFEHIDSLDELAQKPHIRFSGIAPDAPLRLVSGDETINLMVNTVFRANTSEGLLQAIQAGIGVGGMQLPLAAEAVQSGLLVPVLPEWRLPDRFLYAVFPDARFIPQRVRSVVEVIKQLLPQITGMC
ncbi:DNA-binding transcriptional regulator, LysR family [Kosakonia radicincitans]|uniref:LysR family transcriptional regulator n=1 Tax=Kosakonia radicincitans TaxID=283686 RepID=UPI0009A866BC|nr:LysR family transcriptional regulator [Kosakonia radicincitans]SKC17335.1 DNA-binding transcriptional regulator, LysR family [Kosakonia radicincitans]